MNDQQVRFLSQEALTGYASAVAWSAVLLNSLSSRKLISGQSIIDSAFIARFSSALSCTHTDIPLSQVAKALVDSCLHFLLLRRRYSLDGGKSGSEI